MMVRSRDTFTECGSLKGKKIGLSKSLNTIKNDWWRRRQEQGHRTDAPDERHDHG